MEDDIQTNGPNANDSAGAATVLPRLAIALLVCVGVIQLAYLTCTRVQKHHPHVFIHIQGQRLP